MRRGDVAHCYIVSEAPAQAEHIFNFHHGFSSLHLIVSQHHAHHPAKVWKIQENPSISGLSDMILVENRIIVLRCETEFFFATLRCQCGSFSPASHCIDLALNYVRSFFSYLGHSFPSPLLSTSPSSLFLRFSLFSHLIYSICLNVHKKFHFNDFQKT